MTKNELEFSYLGVQVFIRKNFGFQYVFMFFNQEYSGHYDTLENSKQAAKSEIDRVTFRKDYREGKYPNNDNQDSII